MGGKGSGRPTKEMSLVRQTVEKVNPIGVNQNPTGDYILPNHSGISSHPEAKSNFLKIDGSNADQTINIGSQDLETTGDIKLTKILQPIMKTTQIDFTSFDQIDCQNNLVIAGGGFRIDRDDYALQVGAREDFTLKFDGTDTLFTTAGLFDFKTTDTDSITKVHAQGNNNAGAFTFEDTRTGGEAGSLMAGTDAAIFSFSDTGSFNIQTDARADLLATPGTGTNLLRLSNGGKLFLMGDSGAIEVKGNSPILTLKDKNSTGNSSIGYIEWRDSAGTRQGFFGHDSSGNSDITLKNEVTNANIDFTLTGTGDVRINRDNVSMKWGASGDAEVYYDGSDLVINPQVVGSGGIKVLNIKSGATQAGAGAAANELWKTASHATLPDNVVMIGV